VLKRVTRKFHIPIVVNRGYSSVSAMYDAYNRFRRAQRTGQAVKLIYLGDYDPSGLDMIRDITARPSEFFGEEDFDFEVIPVALTREQIDLYTPPPNPAKMTDPRAGDYVARFGHTSWEVDALKPEILNKVLTDNIVRLLDMELYEDIVSNEKADKEKLESLKKYLN